VPSFVLELTNGGAGVITWWAGVRWTGGLPPTLTTAGVFYGYLQLTSKSVWPSTLAHGTINLSFGLFAELTVTTSPLALEYLAGETGVLTLVATALSAAVLLYSLRKRRSSLAVQLPSAA